jgi:hypothetical protein
MDVNYSGMPPGETVEGRDLADSTVNLESAAPLPASKKELQDGYLPVTVNLEEEASGDRTNQLWPEMDAGGVLGRPNGWER